MWTTWWLTQVLLWEVAGAVAVGLAIGYAAGLLQEWSAAQGDLVGLIGVAALFYATLAGRKAGLEEAWVVVPVGSRLRNEQYRRRRCGRA